MADNNLNLKSETIDKAIDLVSDSTQETRNTLDKKCSGAVEKLFQLINATPLGIKAEVYIAERPYKLEKAMLEMKNKYEKIPIENRVDPSSYIALKGMNELNYCLDEEHLKEMFSNLLISDMNSQKKNLVLPTFITTIEQLSKEDAEFLKLLNNNDRKFYTISLKLVKEKGYIEMGKFISYNYKENNSSPSFSVLELNDVVIENLQKQQLIKIHFDKYYTDLPKQYEALFDFCKSKFIIPNNGKIDYYKGCIELTALGKRFIDICLS